MRSQVVIHHRSRKKSERISNSRCFVLFCFGRNILMLASFSISLRNLYEEELSLSTSILYFCTAILYFYTILLYLAKRLNIIKSLKSIFIQFLYIVFIHS